MRTRGSQTRSARRSLAALAAAAAVIAPIAVIAGAAPGQAAGFDGSWSAGENVLTGPTAPSPRAARLEVLPDGGLIAVTVADGAAFDHAGSSVLVSGVRDSAGTWSATEVVDLGTGDFTASTFDTFVDPAGRVLAIWAEKSPTSGLWPVRSVSRSAGGAWGAPEEVYQVATDGAFGDSTEARLIRPRLMSQGTDVAVAWADVQGSSNSRVDIDDNPFQARRWSGGAWGPVIATDGYGGDSASVPPNTPTSVGVWGDPSLAHRDSDGRISFVFALHKHRPVHTMSHPLSDGFELDENEVHVWDGVPERPWTASSESAWVTHLDPADASWSEPAPLITSAGPLVVCGSPTLPTNPPLAAYWSQWTPLHDDPVESSCPATKTRTKSAFYTAEGELRIGLDYSASPTATISVQKYLQSPCDGNGDTFCFDKWDSTDWAVEWPDARIRIGANSGQPIPDSVTEGGWPAPLGQTVGTTSGEVTVTGQSGANQRAIVFDRASGADVTWSHPGITSGSVVVTNVFVRDGDVAVTYTNGTEANAPRCGMLLLAAGQTTVQELTGCTAQAYRQDVIQLADDSLARIDGRTAGAPVHLFAGDDSPEPTPTPTPTEPQPTPPAPPAPVPPAPVPPAPAPTAPAPTDMTAIKAPQITGKVKAGKTLKAKPGTWQPAATTVKYQWLLGKKKIKKATRPELKLVKKWKGKRIAVRITVSAPGLPSTTVTVKAKGTVR